MEYDPTLPNKVIDFAQTFCRLSEPPFTGQPIKLLPYQLDAIKGIYGFIDQETGKLKHTTTSIWIPKKNGKSGFASTLAIFNLLWKPGNKIYIVAPTTRQANVVFGEAAAMCEQHPLLKERLWVRRQNKTIEDTASYGRIEVLASRPEISGFGAGLIIFDELAEFPKCHAETVWNKLKNAGQAKPWFHRIILSTAQFDKSTIGYEQYLLAKQVLRGEIDRPDILPIIFEIDEHENWESPELQLRCNPAANVLWPFSNITEDYETLKTSPREINRFKTLVCNMWCGSAQQWIDNYSIARCGAEFDESMFPKNHPVWIGIDGARRGDLFSYSLVTEYEGKTYFMPRAFIPKLCAEAKQKKDNVPYCSTWQYNKHNHLYLTDGDVVDMSAVRAKLLEDCQRFDVQEIGFDDRGMEETRQILENEGLPMVEVKQTAAHMSGAYGEMEKLIIAGNARFHKHNQLLFWAFGNCVMTSPGAGDYIMIHKGRSNGRVDPVTSSAIGLNRLMASKQNDFFTGLVIA